MLGEARMALHEAEQLAALGHFAAGIAHEINNPAAAVAVNLRFIEEQADPGPNQACVRRAVAEGAEAMSRMTGVVRRLAEAGRLASKAAGEASCELADAVERTLEDVASRFPDGRIRFEVGPLAGLGAAASGSDVHHALHAILLNAAEAVPEGRAGEVTVAARMAGGRVEVKVEDDGVGLDDESLARAFEPFYSTKRPGRGTGLGLTVARALVVRHGGQLRLERRGDRGTRAVLTLPALPGAGAPARLATPAR
jgi:signal transduction histidine kinase